MLTEVADGVLAHRSELLRNNSVLVRGDSGVLLVDPGLTADELTAIADAVGAWGAPVAAGFATHPDWDHVLWSEAFGDVPRYGTLACAAAMREFRDADDWRDRAEEALPEELADQVPLELFGLITALPAGAERLEWAGPRIRVLEHRAHAAGHAALLVEGSGVLVAGDMLSDVFVPMLDLAADDPLGDYLAALDLFEGVAAEVSAVVPGHGSVGRGDELRARIALDRAYVEAVRDGREPADPRIDDAEPGWEWVADIHEGQLAQLRRRGLVPGGADAGVR